MKKTRILLLMVSIFMLTGCSKNKKAEEKTTESEPVGMVIDTKEKKEVM